MLVPRKAIIELGRLIEGEETVAFQQREGHLIFTVGGRTLASKIVEAQFPAFEKVIAVTGDKKVTVGREALQQRDPAREPALVRAQPGGQAEPRRRGSSS